MPQGGLREAEAQKAEAVRKALLKAGYDVSTFNNRLIAVNTSPIDAEEKKSIESAMKSWLAAAQKVEAANQTHVGVSYQVRDMVHNYFANNKITEQDKVLGDEYAQMSKLLPKPKPSATQR